jgi:hypothetical protein
MKKRQKAELIIESCITNEQFDSASDFLGLYMKKYENQKIYDILMFSLTNKRKTNKFKKIIRGDELYLYNGKGELIYKDG